MTRKKPQRHAPWSAQKYKEVVKGNPEKGIISLRQIFTGFEAKDGFDLRHPERWTSGQKRRIKNAFGRMRQLQGQPVTPYKPRSEKQLRQLQKQLHDHIYSRDIKVAFIPTPHQPMLSVGTKATRPQIEITDHGIIGKFGFYDRPIMFFDKKKLVKDPEAEIKRVANLMPDGVAFYYLKMGEYESVAGQGQYLESIIRQTIHYMHKYDGKTPIREGKHRNDRPRDHHWKYWLDGLIGYIPTQYGMSIKEMRQLINKGRKENDERRRKVKNFLKAKGKSK